MRKGLRLFPRLDESHNAGAWVPDAKNLVLSRIFCGHKEKPPGEPNGLHLITTKVKGWC